MNNQLTKIANQVGGSALADNKTHVNRIEIRSASSNRVYVVALSRSTGEWECSCPGWILKKAGKERTCKHLQEMLPSLKQIAESPKALPAPKIKTLAEVLNQVPKETKTKETKAAPSSAPSGVVLNSQVVDQLRKNLKLMEDRGVKRHLLQASVRELIETIEGAINV